MTHLPPPTTPPSPPTPEVTGLVVVDTVARGGQGTVYMAHQLDHDRTVALKVLDARLLDDATRRRFDRERTAVGRLSSHPCIVSLLDSGYTESGEPYLLFEYASGGSLADRLDDGPLDFDEATQLAICVASAVESAHNAGVVHRDIKPGNVMRSMYGDWMLTDFGIASLSDAAATDTLQASYAHAAPETFEGVLATPVADVYSLASLLATCLTGNEPFAMTEHESAAAAVRRIGSEPYPDVRAAGVADDLARFLEAALSKDPARRPVSAYSFAVAVNEVRRAHGLATVEIRTELDTPHDRTVVVEPETAAASTEHRRHRTARPTRRRSLVRSRVLQSTLLVAAVATSGLAVMNAGADPSATIALVDSTSLQPDPAADPAASPTPDPTADPTPDPTADTTLDIDQADPASLPSGDLATGNEDRDGNDGAATEVATADETQLDTNDATTPSSDVNDDALPDVVDTTGGDDAARSANDDINRGGAIAGNANGGRNNGGANIGAAGDGNATTDGNASVGNRNGRRGNR